MIQEVERVEVAAAVVVAVAAAEVGIVIHKIVEVTSRMDWWETMLLYYEEDSVRGTN